MAGQRRPQPEVVTWTKILFSQLTDLHATEVEGNIATMNLGFSVSHCTVSRLSTDAVIDRHNKADCVAPDFCLTKQRSGLHYAYFHTLGVKLNPPKRLEDMYQHCTQTASDVMMYGHEEVLASFSVSGIFVGIPGCSMTRYVACLSQGCNH